MLVSLVFVVLTRVTCVATAEDKTVEDYDYHLKLSAVKENGTCTELPSPCKDGLLLPMWRPQMTPINGREKTKRAAVYLIGMMYFFLGVSLVSDKFMAAIEVITSQEKEVTVNKPEGGQTVMKVKIWNDTVANLTLMALGSSAPEILLSIIEICGNKFEAGDLGPSCIVGSAAYNLFIIIAISIYVVPSNEVRVIKELHVFFVTAAWGVFAYIWLYIILSVLTPGVVDVLEAVMTFVFFILTILTSYIADRKLFCYKYLPDFAPPVYGSPKQTISGKKSKLAIKDAKAGQDQTLSIYEQRRNEYIQIVREMRAKNPDANVKTLEEMAEREHELESRKTKAFYRAQANVFGGSGVETKYQKRRGSHRPTAQLSEGPVTLVSFELDQYQVIEDAKFVKVTVVRSGGDLSKTCHVDYATQDGTATSGSDYVEAKGTVEFGPHQTSQSFEIGIIDDDVFELNEHFFVALSDPRLIDSEGNVIKSADAVKLIEPVMATVVIIDDDHPGIFNFESRQITISEDVGTASIKVCRSTGAKGVVKVPYNGKDGTAQAGTDYIIIGNEIIFQHRELEKNILITIIDDGNYEKKEYFILSLETPQKMDLEEEMAYDTGLEPPLPVVGICSTLTVYIKESNSLKQAVDSLMKQKETIAEGPRTWRDQFTEAITVNPEYDTSPDGNFIITVQDRLPSFMEYTTHFICLFWKLLFAFIPPARYFSGWASFSVSILLIGILTTIIGDLAAMFGCTVGLKDTITAISLVAMGTSLPDTFASKVAAVNERYADAAIGNVNGSNAVNVFLGIGIAWTIAAIYHEVLGQKFRVHAGELAMSVTIFCILAFFAISIILIRRRKCVGGELGGPALIKIISSFILIIFWFIYIFLSSLVIYCIIPGF